MEISAFSSSTSKTVAASEGKLPFYYVMVVWGEKYVDSLLKVTLPCLMAPRNLPALSNLEESRFLIITTPEDALKIADAPIFSSLRDTIATQILTPRWLDDDLPYHLKAARGHMMAAELAVENVAFCVYLAPDFILSDGALLHLEWLARQGKEAVMIPGIRLIRESLLQELAQRSLFKPGSPISLSSRALVEMALVHVHEEDQRYNWDHPCFSHVPVVCTWNVENEKGLMIRAFHLHPILVSMQGARDLSSLASNTIDGDFLGYNIGDWDKIHVEQDSDNIAMFSLTGKDERRLPLIPNTASVERVGALAYGVSVNPLHRYFFTKAIKLHCADLNDNWRHVEEKTARLVYRILREDRFLAGSYLWTVPIPTILWHLALRIRQKPFREWIQFLGRGWQSIKTRYLSEIDAAHKRVMTLWNSASQEMTRGWHRRAVKSWVDAMEVQENAAREMGLRTGIRYLHGNSWTAGFGHIALLDLFAKAQCLGLTNTHHIVLTSPAVIANAAYLECWRGWVKMETDKKKIASYDTKLLEDYPAVVKIAGRWLWLHDAMAVVEDAWQSAGRRPIARIRPEDIERGRRAMARFGMPMNSWFATLHVREQGLVSGSDKTDSIRNARVEDYLPAIKAISDAGGWVVRTGEAYYAPLPEMSQVIDYARYPMKEDWLDVFLLSQARFVIATNSGPAWVAGTFGVPTLLTNWAPIGIKYHYRNAIMIPKRLFSNVLGRPLTPEEHEAEPLAFMESESVLATHGLIPIPNEPKDIVDGVAKIMRATYRQEAAS